MKRKLELAAVATPQRAVEVVPAGDVLEDGMAPPDAETIPAILSNGLESQQLVSRPWMFVENVEMIYSR